MIQTFSSLNECDFGTKPSPELSGIGLGLCVDGHIEEAKEDLPQIQHSCAYVLSSYHLVNQLLGEMLAIILIIY